MKQLDARFICQWRKCYSEGRFVTVVTHSSGILKAFTGPKKRKMNPAKKLPLMFEHSKPQMKSWVINHCQRATPNAKDSGIKARTIPSSSTAKRVPKTWNRTKVFKQDISAEVINLVNKLRQILSTIQKRTIEWSHPESVRTVRKRGSTMVCSAVIAKMAKKNIRVAPYNEIFRRKRLLFVGESLKLDPKNAR